MRYDSLQVGRAIAALAVVVHHAVGRARAAGIGNSLADWYTNGYFGVDYFFVLSGFIIAYSISRSRGGWREFALHRVFRIYPVFWLVFLASLAGAAILPALLGKDLDYSIPELGKAMLLIYQDIPDARGNPPVVRIAWTLQHEMLFYSVATLFLLSRRLGTAAAGMLLAGAVALSLTGPQGGAWDFLLSPMHFEFALGVLSFQVHRKLPPWPAAAVVAIGALGFVLAPRTLPLIEDPASWTRAVDLGIPLSLIVGGFAAFDFAAIGSWCRLYRSPAGSALLRIGNWSYALYLVHYPIVLLFLKLLAVCIPHATAGYLAYLAGVVLCSVAVAGALTMRFERPLQDWLKMTFLVPEQVHAPAPSPGASAAVGESITADRG